MLLSRFWYIFLAVLVGAAASAALLSLGVINRQAAEHVGDELRRDRTELDAILRLEARARLDRIAFISVDNKLGGLLKQAGAIGDRQQLSRLGSETKDTLRGHVTRLVEAAGRDAKAEDIKPDIAIAVDASGRIVAQLGPLESNPPGSSLSTYPFIERALHGYVRDDVVVYDRRVYRIAARPVLYGGEYVGAIAHGYKFDDAFSARVSQGLGDATVLFFYGRSPLASSVPANAPALAEVASLLPDVLSNERFQRGERTDSLALRSGGRALYSLMVGSAAQGEVGYGLARPLTLMASPLAFFQGASREDVNSLPLTWIGLGAIVLAFIGLLFVHLERDRPQLALRKKLQVLASGERERLLITEWRGADRKLADAVNQALDKAIERAAELAPGTKKKANLDEILGPTPESNVEPYFGFADTAAGAKPKPAQRVDQTPAGKDRDKDREAKTPVAAPAQAVPVARPKAPMPIAAPVAAEKAPAPKPSAPEPANVNREPAVKPASALDSAAPSPLPGGNDNAGHPPDEAGHFREVYAQYVNLRRDCGEATEGLSFEKFELTLTKTRDQVLAKHPDKGVRFTVYVKEGKAALKAAPVKR
jgi:hypothetical protein